MLHPLIPFTIKGVLWYLGESNRNKPEKYKNLFTDMVNDWRNRWELGDFPFYFAQIAPFDYSKKDTTLSINHNSAFMREVQLECGDLIPNSGIALLSDIGEKNNIHPANKLEVANRLLYHALNQTYGFKNIDAKSPVYKEMTVRDGNVKLRFDYAESGLFAYDELENFEIAGEDKMFYPANAMILNDSTVVVSSQFVSKPIAVRYGWTDWFKGTLFDKNLLPSSSFRTDKWNDATRYNQLIKNTQ